MDEELKQSEAVERRGFDFGVPSNTEVEDSNVISADSVSNLVESLVSQVAPVLLVHYYLK